jgi:predicted RNA polymerase sigma factor
VAPSPVVEVNRAVALGKALGPTAGLELIDRLRVESSALDRYHLLHSVRGDLLAQVGRVDEARAEFESAAELTDNESERSLLLRRVAELADATR